MAILVRVVDVFVIVVLLPGAVHSRTVPTALTVPKWRRERISEPDRGRLPIRRPPSGGGQ